MTTAKCYGGPLHGQIWSADGPSLQAVKETSTALRINGQLQMTPELVPSMETVRYRLERLSIPIDDRYPNTMQTIYVWVCAEGGWAAFKQAVAG